MGQYWVGIVINELPESFDEGVTLSEGFGDEPPTDFGQCLFAILARAMALSPAEAERLAKDAAKSYGPSSTTVLADSPAKVIRQEKRAAAKLSLGDVSLKNSFVGFKRDCPDAEASAIGIIRLAITKAWWQFWR